MKYILSITQLQIEAKKELFMSSRGEDFLFLLKMNPFPISPPCIVVAPPKPMYTRPCVWVCNTNLKFGRRDFPKCILF